MFFPVPLDDELASLALPLVLTSRRMSSSLEDMNFLLVCLYPRLLPDITVLWTASLPLGFAFFLGCSEVGFNGCRLRDVSSVRGNFLLELELVVLFRLRGVVELLMNGWCYKERGSNNKHKAPKTPYLADVLWSEIKFDELVLVGFRRSLLEWQGLVAAVLSVSRGVSDREGLCVELARVVFFTL
jgi:hypothetical protein